MRILFLTQVLPHPLDAGPKLRAYFVLRHLAQRHSVTLVSFVRSTDSSASLEHLGKLCAAIHTVPMPRSRARDAWHLLRSLVERVPFLIARDRVPRMAKLIDEQLADGWFDAIHADQLWMARYALRPKVHGNTVAGPKLVLDRHNAVYGIPARMAKQETNPLRKRLMELETRKMARYEVQICQRFDRVVWVTGEDHRAVQRQARRGVGDVPNSAVIPICVDPEATSLVARRPMARRITFVGGLHYPPNAQGVLWFAERVFPLVLDRVPDVLLTVIGRRPPRTVANLGRRISRPNLEVTGYAADLAPYLEETAAFIVPLLAGGGMRVKILDAWARGLPVVSTSLGAQGIVTQPGENLLLADTPEAFAEAVTAMLRQPSLGRRIGVGGRRCVEQRYNWRTVYKMWDAVYEGVDGAQAS
jgi:glycosyltransferase involved in cell wall biosynthesis